MTLRSLRAGGKKSICWNEAPERRRQAEVIDFICLIGHCEISKQGQGGLRQRREAVVANIHFPVVCQQLVTQPGPMALED